MLRLSWVPEITSRAELSRASSWHEIDGILQGGGEYWDDAEAANFIAYFSARCIL